MARALAPGKVIFFGEHAVNRRQPAIAAGVDLHAECEARRSETGAFTFVAHGAAGGGEEITLDALMAFKAEIDRLRAGESYEAIQRLSETDFFAPVKYALAHLVEHASAGGAALHPLSFAWRSRIPVAIGLGSGAAASAAMLTAAASEWAIELTPGRCAHMAWQGDVIAHGGIASGLDSGACTFGGFIRYTLERGPERLEFQHAVPIVIGDTGVRANTASVNARVRRWERETPGAAETFSAIGRLASQGEEALREGNLRRLGELMDANHELLRTIGVSCDELERLTGVARRAGAYGAKVAGSGGGGIMVAVVDEARLEAVAEAIRQAGGRAFVTRAGAQGARDDAAIGA